MDIFLSPDNENFIQNQISSRVYKTFNEAVNAVLNIAITGQLTKERASMLNADIQEGDRSFKEGNYSDGLEFINELISEYEQI